MIDRSHIEKALLRLTDIETRLSEPSATSNLNVFRKLVREHAALKRLSEQAKCFFDLQTSLEEYRGLIDDVNAEEELRELARSEIGEVEEALPKAEKDLMFALLPPDSSEERSAIVEVRAGVGQLHVMGRVRRDMERKFLEQVIDPILRFFDRNEEANGFVGKQFMLKEGEVKYAWVFSMSSNDLKGTAGGFCRSFEAAIPRVEVSESPLMGAQAPQSGGQKSGRRGAAPVS